MNITITKPWNSSEAREIEIDNITIRLDGKAVIELFESLDNELHFGDTREDLYDVIEELNEKINDLL